MYGLEQRRQAYTTASVLSDFNVKRRHQSDSYQSNESDRVFYYGVGDGVNPVYQSAKPLNLAFKYTGSNSPASVNLQHETHAHGSLSQETLQPVLTNSLALPTGKK